MKKRKPTPPPEQLPLPEPSASPAPQPQAVAVAQTPTTVTVPAVPEWSWPARVLREMLAIAIWSYVFLKLFVFDVDVSLLKSLAPEYLWLLDYKFLIILGVVAALLLLAPYLLILWGTYIFFYPPYLLLWKIPRFIFRIGGWVLALAVIEFVLSYFRSFRYHVVATALFVIAFTVTVVASDQVLLYLASAILCCLLVVIYARALVRVFKPTNLFLINKKVFAWVRPHAEKSGKLADELKTLPVASMNSAQLDKWAVGLQTTLVFNRVALFYARKLRLYQDSPVGFISAILTTLALLMITGLSFSAMNYAVYKIDPKQFTLTSEPSFWIFVYYSFKNLFFMSVNELTAIAGLSQALSLAQNLVFFFLVSILILLFFQVKTERQSVELNDAISGVEAEGLAMEKFLVREYNFDTIDDALAEIQKTKAAFVKFILYLTSGLK